MRRVASHYIYWKQIYRMHYAELDDQGTLVGVYPLDREIVGTEFYGGIIIPVVYDKKEAHLDGASISFEWDAHSSRMETLSGILEERGFSNGVEIGVPVCLLLLSGISLTAAKLGTDNGCCNGYIKRL